MNADKMIENYKTVMKKYLSDSLYQLLLDNISKVKIKTDEKSNNDIVSAGGDYDPEGIITLYNNAEDITFYHELLHASSTYYNKEKQERFSGFNHQSIPNKLNIGLGFNEGYTQLLTERLFNDGNSSNSYENEVFYVRLIEELVGADKLSELYFKSNLNALISELSKYNSQESIYQFMDNMDLFIILKQIINDKNNENESSIPTLESIQFSQEIDEKIMETYNNLNKFILESFENKFINNTDYENQIERIRQRLTRPKSFLFRKYDMNDNYIQHHLY